MDQDHRVDFVAEKNSCPFCKFRVFDVSIRKRIKEGCCPFEFFDAISNDGMSSPEVSLLARQLNINWNVPNGVDESDVIFIDHKDDDYHTKFYLSDIMEANYDMGGDLLSIITSMIGCKYFQKREFNYLDSITDSLRMGSGSTHGRAKDSIQEIPKEDPLELVTPNAT